MKPGRTFRIAFATVVLLAFHVHAQTATNLSSEAVTNFQWFSSLGFPDVQSCPFVEIPNPNSISRTPTKAFLLMTNLGGAAFIAQLTTQNVPTPSPSEFKYLTLELFQGTLKPAYGAHGRVSLPFNLLNLQSEAQQYIHDLRTLKFRDESRLEERISRRAYIFIFAWGCWRNGLSSQAEELYQLAKKFRYGSEYVSENYFQSQLEQEISYAMMWRAVIDFGNTSISRADLLSEFQQIVGKYPHSSQLARANQTIAMLQRMVAEDEAHGKTSSTNLDQLLVEDRVRELIFRLRDQHGTQGGQPGWCDIFDDRRGQTNSPAHRLARIGYPAVPQLIAALEDQTFTRSVGYWRDFTFSHTVLTVGDCAVEILGRITGCYFYQPNHTAGYMSSDEKVAETHHAAEAWWAEFQKKGEKQMLIEGVGIGDNNSVSQANVLIAHFPDAAEGALIQGIRAAKEASPRTRLIEAFQKFDSAKAKSFFEHELQQGTDGSRGASAEILVRSNKMEVVKRMIEEWETSPDYKTNNDLGWTECARFLAGADSPEAIVALANHLEARPVNTRLAIVALVGTGGARYGANQPISARPTSADAVEKFLIDALQDDGQQSGTFGEPFGWRFADPRVCDIAGYYLHLLWPKRYYYEIRATKEIRDLERPVCRNIWNMAHPTEKSAN